MPASLAKADRAFIISPIGGEGSRQRKLADWVHDNLIRPACARASVGGVPIESFRSDHDRKPGKIIDDVISSIVNERIIFAVLAFDRPNIYYELALAKAAGREVIILQWSREETQFDVRDYRMVRFDFDPDADHQLADPAKIDEIAGFIDAVLKEKPHKDKAFEKFDSLGRNFRDYRFYPRFRDLALDRTDNPNADLYGDVFLEAEQHLTLCGSTLLHFTRYDLMYHSSSYKPACFPDLAAYLALAKGVDIRVILLHPANPNLPGLVASESARRRRGEIEQMRAECAQSFQAWTTIAEDIANANVYDQAPRKGRVDVIQLRNAVIGYRLTVTDKRLVMTPYFRQFAANSAGPTVSVDAQTIFYQAICADLEAVVTRDRAIADETGS
jgi:hypothetical protein